MTDEKDMSESTLTGPAAEADDAGYVMPLITIDPAADPAIQADPTPPAPPADPPVTVAAPEPPADEHDGLKWNFEHQVWM